MKKQRNLLLALIVFAALFASVPVQAATARQNACALYRKYLNSIISTRRITYFLENSTRVTDSVSNPSSYTFGLKDLNSDGIPELFVTGYFRGTKTAVWTYYNGIMYENALDNRLTYYKFTGNKKIFMVKSSSQGIVLNTYMTISKGQFRTVATRGYYQSYGTYGYLDKNNRATTKTKFLNAIKQYGVNLSTSKSSKLTKYRVTSSNVYNKCR